jgi:NMD protein affecting ribosome stability and mRNA decay
VPTESPGANIKASATDVPFLDAEAISSPGGEEAAGVVDMVPGESPRTETAETSHETSTTPCPDCQRYAQIGYIAGAVLGIVAGGVVAYVILRSRLAPIAD